MSIAAKVRHELVAVIATTAYFAACFGVLLLLKTLVLAEYDIRFHRLSLALLGALVIAKVVLVLEHVPLWRVYGRPPAWVDVLARTGLYACGAVAALLLEKAFEARHEYGGIGAALASITSHADINHIWAAGIVVTGALMGFNALSILRRHLGPQGLLRIAMAPVPQEPTTKAPAPQPAIDIVSTTGG